MTPSPGHKSRPPAAWLRRPLGRIGLASVIVGMAIFPARTIVQATMACLAGAMVYRFAVALALNADFLGLQASDVQVVTAVLVALTLMSRSVGGIGRLLTRRPAR